MTSTQIRFQVMCAGYSATALLGMVLAVQSTAEHAQAADPVMRAVRDAATGQIDIVEGNQPILRYNYQTVSPPDGAMEKIRDNSRKYAAARSNYIHPLYGPDGEVLTEDWSIDHPHHRGIYWAWPEVDFGDQRGDLHALQRVFARPTGNIKLTNGDQFAQVEAENLWQWEDKTPIVREVAIIRAHRLAKTGRFVDLTFHLTALKEGVTVARRGTDKYGGLNIRLSPVKDIQIILHTDPENATPRRAWTDSMGVRSGGQSVVGFGVLQKSSNPGYPGDWVEYPQLPWFQPTFPPAGQRFALKRDEPLTLQYRLWIRRGKKLTADEYGSWWQAFDERTQP